MEEEILDAVLDKLKDVRGMNPKSGMAYALVHFSQVGKIGIGLSRRELTRSIRDLSPFIHSWSTYHRYMGIAKEFVQYCKEAGVNKLHKLVFSTVEGFLKNKIDKGATKSTVKINMCALMKFLGAVERHDLKDELSARFQDFKCSVKKFGAPIHSFDDTGKLIQKIEEKSPLSAVIARIVEITGARIHEVRSHISVEEPIVQIKGKGGRIRVLDFSTRVNELRELEELRLKLKELSIGVNWKEFCQKKGAEYQKNVKRASRSMGDEYRGAHGLRANFAQKRLKDLEEAGLTPAETTQTVTNELGHCRKSMAAHYGRV
jgi:integrase